MNSDIGVFGSFIAILVGIIVGFLIGWAIAHAFFDLIDQNRCQAQSHQLCVKDPNGHWVPYSP